jgi:hypothetical protein
MGGAGVAVTRQSAQPLGQFRHGSQAGVTGFTCSQGLRLDKDSLRRHRRSLLGAPTCGRLAADRRLGVPGETVEAVVLGEIATALRAAADEVSALPGGRLSAALTVSRSRRAPSPRLGTSWTRLASSHVQVPRRGRQHLFGHRSLASSAARSGAPLAQYTASWSPTFTGVIRSPSISSSSVMRYERLIETVWSPAKRPCSCKVTSGLGSLAYAPHPSRGQAASRSLAAASSTCSGTPRRFSASIKRAVASGANCASSRRSPSPM